jgi:hypothetical protein
MIAMLFRTVQSNADICGNCFRRTHHSFERNYAVDTYKVDEFEWETWHRKVDLPDRSYPVRANRVSVPEDVASQGLRNYCACGYPSGEQLRPLPKKLFFSYAGNLYERYVEFGVEIDQEAFIGELETLKTDPSKQFADDRLFEEATQEALETTNGLADGITEG